MDITRGLIDRIRIRAVSANDAEKFLHLQRDLEHSGYMLHEPGERVVTVEEESERLENIEKSLSTNIWIAELNNDIIGQITVVRKESKRSKHSAYLSLGIRSDYQEQGIAGELLEYVFRWAKDNGVKRLELTVIKDNNRAVQLYKKKGFKIEGEKINSLIIDNDFANEYYMYKFI